MWAAVRLRRSPGRGGKGGERGMPASGPGGGHGGEGGRGLPRNLAAAIRSRFVPDNGIDLPTVRGGPGHPGHPGGEGGTR